MSVKSNQVKNEQLQMSHSTAQHRLRKSVLFHLLKKLGENNCQRCGERIETIADLSIEHKIPWLHSEDPVGLFFNMDNIAFSHLSCNIKDARRPGPIRTAPKGLSWCSGCKQNRPVEDFGPGPRYNGLRDRCNKCRKGAGWEKG